MITKQKHQNRKYIEYCGTKNQQKSVLKLKPSEFSELWKK